VGRFSRGKFMEERVLSLEIILKRQQGKTKKQMPPPHRFPSYSTFVIFRAKLLICLAGLVSDSAGGFAGGLAGSLALSAAALSRCFLEISLIDCFNVLHGIIFLSLILFTAHIFKIMPCFFYYSICLNFFQGENRIFPKATESLVNSQSKCNSAI